METDISIIVPLYKGMKYIQNLLEMINRNCLYRSLYKECVVEVIFINDYPEENIELEKYDNSFKMKLIRHESNLGIHATRVTGIKNAAGKYVIMFDQDDFVMDQWLYEQWKKIMETEADFCVCNGWLSRFRVWRSEKDFGENFTLDYFLSVGNGICSPGQVIMKRSSIPKEWMENIQNNNGSDDYLLWIMALKKCYTFVVNNKYLYYHNPDRTLDSVDRQKMRLSLNETVGILARTGYLDTIEKKRLESQIKDIRCKKNYNCEDILKFRTMFLLMHDWMQLRNRGICICEYMKSRGYVKVAIHGMGYIGECLYQEIYNEGMQVAYAIDRSARDIRKKLKIIRLEDEFEKVDLIITTVMGDMTEDIKALERKGRCPVLKFSHILMELGQKYN